MPIENVAFFTYPLAILGLHKNSFLTIDSVLINTENTEHSHMWAFLVPWSVIYVFIYTCRQLE